MAALFLVAAYDAAREFVCMVDDRDSMEVAPSHNQIGSATLVLKLGHAAVPALMEPGARLKFWYKGAPIFSGDVDEDTSNGGPLSGDVKFTIRDHKAILWDMLAFPVPSKVLTQQTTEYYTLTGPAETVFKTIVTANIVTRGKFPGVTVAPDLGRGDTISVQLRFDSIGEVVVPMLDAVSLGVSVVMDEDGVLLVDVYETGTYPLVFSMEAGTLAERNWSRKKPTATRAIVGGVGEGVDRIFDQVTDSTMESLYGAIAETFIDATNTGKMVTDQWKLIEDAQSAVESASSGIEGPSRTLSDARSKYDAADAAYWAGDRARRVALAAAAGQTGGPLHNAWELATSNLAALGDALKSAESSYNSANSSYNSARSALTSARSALTAAKNALPAKITAHRTELRALGSLKLAQMGAKAGLQLRFAETDVFSYGGAEGATVGDVLQVKLLPKRIVDGKTIPAVVLTDVMRSAVLTEASSTHAEIAPDVGDFHPLPEQVHALVTAKNTTDIQSTGRHK